MPKKTEEVQETQLEAPPMPSQQQPQFQIVEERDLPRALVTLINNSNRELQQTQQRLMQEINDSANELMDLLALSREQGWLLDTEGLRFVRVEPVTE